MSSGPFIKAMILFTSNSSSDITLGDGVFRSISDLVLAVFHLVGQSVPFASTREHVA